MVINADIRRTIVTMISKSSAAHIGTAFSEVEILNAIFASIDKGKILGQAVDRDRIILSKGHGAAGLYAVMFHQGLVSQDDIELFFINRSVMSGHVSHFIDNVEHSTGALGHGLSVGLGIALGCRSKGYINRIFVVVGDGELNEGSNWEAIMYAGHQSVGNICLIIDKNERTMTGMTSDECSIDPLASKLNAFNFNTYNIDDGHDELEIRSTIKKTADSIRPVAIICNTVKGKGVSFMEGNIDWHYRPPKGKELYNALSELEGL